MAKAELKTKVTRASVTDFIAGVKDGGKRKDCQTLLKLMKKVTGEPPRMWGPSMVGFGEYHYKGKSGREGTWFVTGFSPRSQALTIYLMAGMARIEPLARRLGKHKAGKGCLYIKRLEDVDLKVLEQMVSQSAKLSTGT